MFLIANTVVMTYLNVPYICRTKYNCLLGLKKDKTLQKCVGLELLILKFYIILTFPKKEFIVQHSCEKFTYRNCKMI